MSRIDLSGDRLNEYIVTGDKIVKISIKGMYIYISNDVIEVVSVDEGIKIIPIASNKIRIKPEELYGD